MADGCILLIERRRKDFGRYYVIPGGGVEAGEDPRAAVVRELREETGLRATVLREVFRGTTPRGNRHTYYLCRAPRLPVALPKRAEENAPERIALRGTVTPRWVPTANVERLRLLPPVLRPYLQQALRVGFPSAPVELRELVSGGPRRRGRH